jgi:UDP-N-acetylglucosamine 2-epimerase (non-hydrolysing)
MQNNVEMRLIVVAGARPNFMKVAPIIDAIKEYNRSTNGSGQLISYYLVHTGQHYDEKMSKLFFDDLGIPEPDINLGVGSSSHAEQTAEIMKQYEKICLKYKPTHVLLVGDVNSTIACALVSSKMNVKIIHVEAGLRSFDRSMPEEINRILTDAISEYLFITEESAKKNLLREGIPEDKIFFVGNVMIDTLLKHRKKAEKSSVLDLLGLNRSANTIQDAEVRRKTDRYGLVTLHRPSNVDSKENLKLIMDVLDDISHDLTLIFPCHPRTRDRIEAFGFAEQFNIYRELAPVMDHKVNLVPPLGYLDFLQLMSNAKLVLTDSGGIQEETTVLGVPCITLRENTERPITITEGTNHLTGINRNKIFNAVNSTLNSRENNFKIPKLWDGHSAKRIIEILVTQNKLVRL